MYSISHIATSALDMEKKPVWIYSSQMSWYTFHIYHAASIQNKYKISTQNSNFYLRYLGIKRYRTQNGVQSYEEAIYLGFTPPLYTNKKKKQYKNVSFRFISHIHFETLFWTWKTISTLLCRKLSLIHDNNILKQRY